MGQTKPTQLENIQLENVTFQIEGLDPILKSVDLDVPMDKTVIVNATNPAHAVVFLQILAGKADIQQGRIKWLQDEIENELPDASFFNVVSSYFETNRPHPESSLAEIFKSTACAETVIQSACEHFNFTKLLNKKFKSLSFAQQKLVMLVASTFCIPQMLVLEDPAVGLSEEQFLDFLDWIQYWQRQGHIRHIFLTNNHPTAARHLEFVNLFIDEGLVYVEDEDVYKKVVHF